MTELKNCPFCGSEITRHTDGFTHASRPDCFIFVMHENNTLTPRQVYLDRLYSAWNTRQLAAAGERAVKMPPRETPRRNLDDHNAGKQSREESRDQEWIAALAAAGWKVEA